MSARLFQRSALWLALLANPAMAQFAQLAATDDGSQLYFTSRLVLRDVPVTSVSPFPEARLYRFGPDGVTLFAERGSQASQTSGGSNAGVQSPQVSGDGRVIGFTFTDFCATDPHCQSPGSEGEIRGQQTLDAGPGALVLSHDGRWVLLTQNVPNLPVGINYVSALLDVTTGQRVDVPAPPVGALHTLAADGSLLVFQAGTGYNIWRQGQLTPVQGLAGLAVSSRGLTYTDDASTMVFIGFSAPAPGTQPIPSPKMSLMALDIAAGKLTTLFQPDSSHIPVLMGASSNGKAILYRVNQPGGQNGPAYFVNRDTGQTIGINLPDGEFVSDGILNGPGDVAFLVTTAGRIVKAIQSTHTVEPLFPGTPYCDTTSSQAAGSLAWFSCSFTASVSELQNRVLINQIPAPVLNTSPGQIEVQIPWEVSSGFNATLSLQIPSGSPFLTSEPLTILPAGPRPLMADPGQHTFFGLDMIKGDWSGYQTDAPGPGDIVYLYLTGLGPVRGSVQTGVPASPATTNPILGTFSCRFRPQQQDAETLFAGLAPEMIGIYQVNLRIPSDAGQSPITGISCNLQGAGFSGGFSFTAPGGNANTGPSEFLVMPNYGTRTLP